MSVLKQAAATPSRITAVYHYLLRVDGQAESRERLEAVLSPDSIITDGSRDMIHNVINECVKMGLVESDEGKGEVRLHTDLPKEARNRRSAMQRLPLTVADLIFRGNAENRDLALIIAWYLEQNVVAAPGDWKTVAETLGQQVGGDCFGLTSDVRYHQFDDWACFLGFAWHHGGRREILTPDPTQHVRWRLKEVFRSPGTRLTPAEAVRRLAEVCPVMEMGMLRSEVCERMGRHRERELSSVSAFAWFRLWDEGCVDVESAAGDADVFILPDGNRSFRCTSLTWPEKPAHEHRNL